MWKILNVFLFIAACLMFSCEEREKNDPFSGNSLSIGDGEYDLEQIHCSSNDEVPDYAAATEGTHKAIAFVLDFDNLEESLLVIEDGIETITLKNTDCELTVERNIIKNSGGQMQHSNEVFYTWEPEDCSLSKTVAGQEYVFNTETPTGAFEDSNDTGSSLRTVLTLSTVGGSFVRSTGFTDLSNLGCDIVDSLTQKLTRRL